MNNESLGSQLRVERCKRNMSQEKVCEELNMTTRTLGNIENDKGNHRQSTLNKLIEFYELDPDELE
ncbi:helix-turn-helix transcriptional regulator [Bacillus sp. ISL-35]|uniref:helix-turn-helix domain-containing protein n=1 Tax=Bacillus sp. ISL-35 TaxID=2819122 RepID=UPI001BECEA4E|nr:helix-turn-helix transcriptional regulator [Bacillus sp. ISL-35]MBT2680070.1 helix-turn-helix transcriptional regulator [Bacillus sp. ISL-35]MBT2702953.1 helix-turn-helix transcriptional regulator [Chryseobacterium sp. ISL-80]